MLTNDMETKRLVLRSTREEWGPLCVDIWLDEEMGRYMADPPRDKAGEEYANFGKGIETEEGWFPFTVFSRETGEFVGTCSVVPKEDGKCWDFGYAVHKKFWRQGYCTEMLNALMDWGRREGAVSFTADVAQENTASCGVLRKLGFRVVKEGSFRKRGTDIVYPEYTWRLDME